MVEMGLLG